MHSAKTAIGRLLMIPFFLQVQSELCRNGTQLNSA